MTKIKSYIKRLYNIIIKPEMKVLPGALAFFLFLSLVPILTLVVYIGLILSVGTDSVLSLVNQIFPADVSSFLMPYVSNAGIDANTILFMIIGFLVASNGSHMLIVSSNTLYNIPHSSYLKRRIKALFMTMLLISLLIFTIVFLAFGSKILTFLTNLNILSNISYELHLILSLFKWPMALFIIYIIVKILYTWAPDKRIPSKYTNRGSVFTTISWLIVTIIYSIYINNFPTYNVFYGSLSNIAVIMIWVYVLSLLLVIGMAINNEHYEMNKDK